MKNFQKNLKKLLTLFLIEYIFSITVATLSCDTATKQSFLTVQGRKEWNK